MVDRSLHRWSGGLRPTGAVISGLKVEGMRELRRAVKATGTELEKELGAIHKKVAEPIAAAARARAPRRDGDLAGSIRASGTRRTAKVTAGGIGGVVYAGPIHFGWPGHNIEPQPFLQDALYAEAGSTHKLYEAEIDDWLRRIWRAV